MSHVPGVRIVLRVRIENRRGRLLPYRLRGKGHPDPGLRHQTSPEVELAGSFSNTALWNDQAPSKVHEVLHFMILRRRLVKVGTLWC